MTKVQYFQMIVKKCFYIYGQFNFESMCLKKGGLVFVVFIFFFSSYAQNEDLGNHSQDKNFWKQVSFGGGVGLSFGDGFFLGGISPSAVYNFNQYVSAGLGLTYNYLSDKRTTPDVRVTSYGGSIITLFNPLSEIQLSVELEGIQVDRTFLFVDGDEKDNFFQEALFLGGGYRTGNITIGARYNVLHDEDRSVYGSAFLPFVRVFF